MLMSFRLSISLIMILLFSGCALNGHAPEITPNGVKYSYRDPLASSVAVVGSFNHWDSAINRLAGPDASGIWTITLPLPPGRHEYRFVVNDSQWVLDPAAPAVDDGLGGSNSVIDVP